MRNNKTMTPKFSEKDFKKALESYAQILKDNLKYKQGETLLRASISPCSNYVMVALFKVGLAPSEDADIWKSRPKNMPPSEFEVVGGSDIFVCKANNRNVWGKFAAKRDSVVLSNILFDEYINGCSTTKSS